MKRRRRRFFRRNGRRYPPPESGGLIEARPCGGSRGRKCRIPRPRAGASLKPVLPVFPARLHLGIPRPRAGASLKPQGRRRRGAGAVRYPPPESGGLIEARSATARAVTATTAYPPPESGGLIEANTKIPFWPLFRSIPRPRAGASLKRHPMKSNNPVGQTYPPPESGGLIEARDSILGAAPAR